MNSFVYIWSLFCLLVRPAVPTCTSTDYTFYVEKQECDSCAAIHTTVCMGFCNSWERNVKQVANPHFRGQRGCTYNRVEYRTVVLPGCPLSADALFTYPVALSCHCSTCNTTLNECTQRAAGHASPCSKPVKHIYSYPGQSSYIHLN